MYILLRTYKNFGGEMWLLKRLKDKLDSASYGVSNIMQPSCMTKYDR